MIDPVHDIQSAYRKLVQAYSFPGTTMTFSASELDVDVSFSLKPGLLNLAIMLFDNKTSAYFHNVSKSDIDLIRQFTNTNMSELADADFIVLNGLDEQCLKDLEKVKLGVHQDPQLGATVMVLCESLDNLIGETHKKEPLWKVFGPGIKESYSMASSATEAKLQKLIELRNKKCAEFPLGFELIFLDDKNQFMVFPRSTRITNTVEVA
jgi:alpha-D-ribose 1-methylphosphonate 5-triphosphate synthase subunit PhnH